MSDDKSSGEKRTNMSVRWYAGICIIAFACIAFYWLYFDYYRGYSLSSDPTLWGAFGDYIGGLLNPVVAFFAFVLLAKSVRIQQTELRKSTEALAEAGKAQNNQVAVRKAAGMIDALSTLISAIDSDIDARRYDYKRVVDAIEGKVSEVYFRGRVASAQSDADILTEIKTEIVLELRSLEDSKEIRIEHLNDYRALLAGLKPTFSHEMFPHSGGMYNTEQLSSVP